MSRDQHPRYVPFAETRIALVDQQAWEQKDTFQRVSANGISAPIYSCMGTLNRTLPLDKYPRINEVHPEVRIPLAPHFEARSQELRNYIMSRPNQGPYRRYDARVLREGQKDMDEGRIEGLYIY